MSNSKLKRIAALIPASFVFLILLPFLMIVLGKYFDSMYSLISVDFGFINQISGLIIAIGSFLFAFWTVIIQFNKVEGTPIPKGDPIKTKKLITDGLYKYCRNPMMFGTFLLYLGLALYFKSFFANIFVLIFIIMMRVYIKKVEEKELEKRFGEEYKKYKENTSFFIPKRNKK